MSTRSSKPDDSRPIPVAKLVAPPEPRWAVLLWLFVAMGPLALPMLWRSPHFSRRAKAVLTVLVFLIFAVAVVALVYAAQWFIGWLNDVIRQG
jgi:hypothetical protein